VLLNIEHLEVTGLPGEGDWPGVSHLPLYQEWYEYQTLLSPPPGLIPPAKKACKTLMRHHLHQLCHHHGADGKGVELALRLLELPPRERLSAHNAAGDPWFEADPATRQEEVSGEGRPLRHVVQRREWNFSAKQIEACNPSRAAGFHEGVEMRQHAEVCLERELGPL